ncbi:MULTISPECIES: glucose PTS transporter transcription antiterminator GlcT [Cytobacillus]|uniref:Transcriptional antiterminator n=3 Tax=Cytobacillus TaxID=2675230 RepID=A0A160M6U3_9BACI|nr:MULTISPECIES: PRD domain-containing protein [Cytobacillus]MBY0162507.1 PRD domain-containing protein [Cytobacillus firmus]AND37934.1 transcriptional antiterminator [Cytobacillus oceanisediminis 2691]MBU8733188.1 PRD domain-containing protein [Cytobacillus oceanisediminis]MBU8773122.1 PRD domain-containing protein [Cytobacillus oceanisediminis]MCM3395839.1 PRD domain-containing protein [Cytobacillus oceanisediminis]
MGEYKVKKVLNNNVLIGSHESFGEVVLIGKGIGFSRRPGQPIDSNLVEKLFVLKNEKEQENYIKLMPFVDNELLEAIISSIQLIKQRANSMLNEHIHVALTDHLMFAITRLKKGMEMKNPFLIETKTLYPFEYEIAHEVVNLIGQRTGIYLPEGEIGFIALHVHSAVMNRDLSEVNQHSQLVTHLVNMIEEQLDIKIDKDSIDYMRLVRHIRFTIERVNKGEVVEEPEKITSLLKEEYPVCYNLSWKLIKVMQQTLKKPVFNAEAVYLTMHLQRLQKKIN